MFVVGFRTEMKRANADKLSNAVDSQKHEIKLLLEPTKQSAGIIKESTLTNSNEKVVYLSSISI